MPENVPPEEGSDSPKETSETGKPAQGAPQQPDAPAEPEPHAEHEPDKPRTFTPTPIPTATSPGARRRTAGAHHGPSAHEHDQNPQGKVLFGLCLAALGIVYGDIGTSPIYAIRESFHEAHGLPASPENVLGILSLIFWSLLIVISFKYLFIVMRADSQGEGGIMVLSALVTPPGDRPHRGRQWVLLLLGLFGAALLWGDSMITPAISVLSAIEGLEVATPVFKPYVIPITIGILFGLFLFQRRGTAGVGAVFGPVTAVWFLVLIVLGVAQLVQHPSVLRAIGPWWAIDFFLRNQWKGFFVLGSVFLVVTGGEALYADMGHFGKKPIQLTWFAVVLPALLINYFGQGALILSNPKVIEHPFYSMAPHWSLYPLLVITTAATVIASQAVISGAFSLTRQAIQLGYLPRMQVLHTSTDQEGQIYLPAVNWALAFACVALVIGFKTSSNLAAAYGVAVTTTMVFTTILFAVVAYRKFKWNGWWLALLTVSLLVMDLGFWISSMRKIPEGGWFPLLVALGFFTLMTTWKRGRFILAERLADKAVPYSEFFERIDRMSLLRAPGTAIFMHSDPRLAPPALLDNIEHNHVMHERNVDLTVITREVPFVEEEDRVTLTRLRPDLYTLQIQFGYAEDPNVPEQLAKLEVGGQAFDMDDTTFFIGNEQLIATDRPGMAIWRERLFSRMSRNALRATAWFHLPTDRVVELASTIEL